MGNIAVRQSISGYVAQNPDAGASIQNKFLDINPPEVFETTDYNETCGGYFALASGQTDQSLAMGTVVAGKIFIFKPSADIGVKFVNSLGDSQLITFKGGRRSVINAEFTGIKLTTGVSAVSGSYSIVGD